MEQRRRWRILISLLRHSHNYRDGEANIDKGERRNMICRDRRRERTKQKIGRKCGCIADWFLIDISEWCYIEVARYFCIAVYFGNGEWKHGRSS